MNIKEKKRGAIARNIIYNKYIYIMLVPAIIFYLIFSYYPMYGVTLAFKEFNFKLGIMDSPWVGFENFKDLIYDKEMRSVFLNTAIISFGRIIFQFPIPIILAILLNEMRMRRYKGVLQTVFTFPHFLSWVICAGIIKNFLRTDGFVNVIIQALGFEPIPFLMKAELFKPIIFMTDIWKEAGWSTIIYLAAITAINGELFEAATVDGANRFQKIIYVTLPAISGTICFLLILSIANIMNAGFDQIFNMMNSVVKSSGQIIDTYIYEITFQRAPDYSFSTAVGLFKSIINFSLIFVADRIIRKIGGKGIYE